MTRFLNSRAVLTYVIWAVMLAVIVVLTSWKLQSIAIWWVQISLWLIVVGLTLQYFIVLVPEITGLRALNQFTGEIKKAFIPGINFKFPWETVKEENFFSLETVTKKLEETYASADGPMMHVKASYQYHPHQDRLDKYMAVDETTIEIGFHDVLSSLLSQIISGKDALTAREKIKEIEQGVLRMFDEKTIKNISLREKLEDQYGINFKLFTVADIDFSEDYQKMRSAQARMRSFAETTKNLQTTLGDPTLTAKDAANIMLVEQGKADKTIYEVEGLDKLEGLDKALPIIAGVLGKYGKKKEGKKTKNKRKRGDI